MILPARLSGSRWERALGLVEYERGAAGYRQRRRSRVDGDAVDGRSSLRGIGVQADVAGRPGSDGFHAARLDELMICAP